MIVKGSKIAEFRGKAGLTQEELGAKIGVSKRAIANWEQGIHGPNIKRQKALVEFFDTRHELLFSYI